MVFLLFFLLLPFPPPFPTLAGQITFLDAISGQPGPVNEEQVFTLSTGENGIFLSFSLQGWQSYVYLTAATQTGFGLERCVVSSVIMTETCIYIT